MRLRPLLLAAAVLASAAPAAADSRHDGGGGPLSQVVNGLKEKSGQTGDSGGHSGAVGEPAHDSTPSPEYGGGGYAGGYAGEPRLQMGVGPYPTTGEGTESRLYLGLHSVEGSNGAGVASLRSSFGANGIELDDIRYFERMDGGDYLHMDVWAIGFAHRTIAMGTREQTALWLKGGLAGANSDGLQLLGAVIGAEVDHNLGPALGIEASARYFLYQDDIRALELRAGVAASILRVSYRLMRFDVGPPLRGPEVGVALLF
ncbi:MAG TPA: hypothetical protein VL172_03425 [Kofleriaceae bacterium]|jgi:hypothetical protein|nr:hypothetical protein [Kofleriaceae bacterium]